MLACATSFDGSAIKTPYVKVRWESRANMSTIQGPPGGLFGKPIVPAPAALKGPAGGPLRALDRFGRGHGFSIMAGEPAPPQDTPPAPPCSVSQYTHVESASRKTEPRSPVTEPSLLEYLLVVRPTVPTDGDDDPKPDIAEHPNRFCMVFPTLASLIVVSMGPPTASETRERKLPQRFPQGMDTGAAKVHGAGGPTLFRDRSGARLALGNVRIAISVAIIAQFSDHPGGEDISSTGQAEIKLAS